MSLDFVQNASMDRELMWQRQGVGDLLREACQRNVSQRRGQNIEDAWFLGASHLFHLSPGRAGTANGSTDDTQGGGSQWLQCGSCMQHATAFCWCGSTLCNESWGKCRGAGRIAGTTAERSSQNCDPHHAQQWSQSISPYPH